MGYDTRPLLTLKEKKSFLDLALAEDAFLFLEHDPNHQLISLKETEKGVRMHTHFNFDSYFNT
jgi:hypothetical protein